MKKRLNVIFLGLIIILSIVVVTHRFIATDFMSSRYVLTPNAIKAIFANTPERLLKFGFTPCDECENFFKNASLDKNGNIILRLSPHQKECLRDYYSGAIENAREVGIYVSSDYTEISMVGNEEEVLYMFEHFPLALFLELSTIQLLDGVPADKICVKLDVVEKYTGNILYSAYWPTDDIHLTPSEWKFSESNN